MFKIYKQDNLLFRNIYYLEIKNSIIQNISQVLDLNAIELQFNIDGFV